MLISYKEYQFDTHKDIEIAYIRDAEIRNFIEHIMMSLSGKGALPSTVGFVFEYFPFISNLSIIENIILPLEYHEHLNKVEAVDRVSHYINRLGLEGVVLKRKEVVGETDLFKAMFVRALAMNPGLVFIGDFKNSVTIGEFREILPLFREVAGTERNMWVGMSEGRNVKWEHDMEVVLD
ncbi:hypothetical protein BMS3Abin07_00294 [bacterium BMS3Abin07]|nr:hypothetical protein BMS3Abin07_00294 [bacterium BMS3Abin07]GBE31801.1 hypothetical protein BMS3Bbin05_00704 [bacterium BMS3Bbin05]HDO21875.1 hypothetical protein [Nitrospirota bacterium]HDZ88607.1 hypothetical protein [Nitrospirota bacterium]